MKCPCSSSDSRKTSGIKFLFAFRGQRIRQTIATTLQQRHVFLGNLSRLVACCKEAPLEPGTPEPQDLLDSISDREASPGTRGKARRQRLTNGKTLVQPQRDAVHEASSSFLLCFPTASAFVSLRKYILQVGLRSPKV